MKFSYNWLKEFVSFKESPEKLAELLTLKSFEVESVEKAGGDWLLNIALLPNRIPDASGHMGLAREISAVTGAKLKNDAFGVKKYSTGLIRQFLDVKVENSQDCPRYMALMIDGVKVKESPAWLKQRMELCGLQPINNLVDAANYTMLETGQPLHVFDYSKLDNKEGQKYENPNHKSQIPNKSQTQNPKNKKIVVRKAKKGEKLLCLDDKEYELNPETLVIADSEKPVAIAGIKGGKESGINSETRTIVLEAANFNPILIRSGSKSLNLKTDASYRFEHGLDPNLTDFAIRRLADLILRLSGENAKGIIDVYPQKTLPLKLLFHLEYADRLIGIQIPPQFYKNALLSLGINLEEKNKTDFIVEIPTMRRDLIIEEDVIEEAARLYGYEKMPAILPGIPLFPPEENAELFWENKIKNNLLGFGFNESFIYEFTGDKELAGFEEPAKDYLELENPTSPETKYLTARPLIKYIQQVSENLKNFDSTRVFGVAKAFIKDPVSRWRPGLNGGCERKQLILTIAQKGSKGEEEFYELKGVIDDTLESLGIAEYWYKDENCQFPISNFQLFHPYRKTEIYIGNQAIGILGEIHPVVAKNIKSKARIVAAEIDFSSLWQLAEKEAEYKPISKYPAIIRDIAIIVPFNIKTESILNVIENTGGEFLTDIDLFDYFYDEKMKNKSQKSLAFHLRFESKEKTLKDEEIDEIMRKIIDDVDKKGWIVRK
ncbi:MAG: phenylalanine--tRNA ligase subunit beta [Candidatus Sungbacteria bacterium RIFCSPLOWO2_12_FULL_41_11]|uniref:Phenylalanine--tRNA ligase beta subunit n=1 Tax=Candidatus Sungbacteria bacterium RIFCSPLOWO2_12_FULL_41_11 TaxID=1802286 RepID=A0A1G2LQG3_9BACT|nr:MAG: Phenylalanine-tRNA ligase beta subunit [Parcubacteria group bacterium GW2011_GWA2_42_14]OHA13031.1 MAG: phenylalanine--tRNA ligase subunit beta [Candidatus Sungbacteria bacterium RIFCSPLOWO2_12_FULL_41_11]